MKKDTLLLKKSWYDIKKNFSLIVPDIVFTFFSLLVLVLGAVGSGLASLVMKWVSLEGTADLFEVIQADLLASLNTLVTTAIIVALVLFVTNAKVRAIKLGMIHDIIKKKKPSLRKTFSYIRTYFWRLLGLQIITTLIITGLVAVGIYAIFGLGATLGVWAVLVFLLVILAGFIIYFVLFFSRAALVMNNLGAIDAIKHSRLVFWKHKGFVVQTWLLVIAISILVSIVAELVNLIPFVNVLSIFIYLVLGIWTSMFIFNRFMIVPKAKRARR